MTEKEEIEKLDEESIRPLRAAMLGQATEEDIKKLKEIELKIKDLRLKIKR